MTDPLYITASSAIGHHKVFVDAKQVFETGANVQAPQFLEQAYDHIRPNYPKFYKMDLLSKLGWLTAEYLLKSDEALYARIRQLAPESVCLLLMNASSSLDTDAKYYKSVAQMASPSLFVYTLPNIVMGEICIRHGFKGENMFLIQEKFNAKNLELQVKLMMGQPGNEVCICGWVEWLNNEYRSVLYLVENNRAAQSVIFTAENILSRYPQ